MEASGAALRVFGTTELPEHVFTSLSLDAYSERSELQRPAPELFVLPRANCDDCTIGRFVLLRIDSDFQPNITGIPSLQRLMELDLTSSRTKGNLKPGAWLLMKIGWSGKVLPPFAVAPMLSARMDRDARVAFHRCGGSGW
ncbi:hypothetical protein DOTSEDRAFT_72423 [Dothistroma septosporum NZE10]|uniref:Uncharacterized protein n=1 Tax=Dothistroma septosporum (strain NZE10 / CBS 128990) TaxID=675120 RepID=M2WLU9_DOTSN|nr:hypothetical protein DOTSEDRAFT_72423 [Dothistroma septosporum NZE10]